MFSSIIPASLVSWLVQPLFFLADVSTAFSNLATMLAGYLPGILAFVLVIAGYMYVTSIGDAQNAMHAKRGIGAAIAGGILITLAVTLATTFYTTVTK